MDVCSVSICTPAGETYVRVCIRCACVGITYDTISLVYQDAIN